MALPRVQSPPSLSEPLVSLKSSSLQGVVSWLHSVVRGFASNLEAEKQQWESQAQELRGETRELRRRLEGLEAAAPADPERPATDESNVDLGEQLRALERRVDLWREEQLLQRDTEVHVASVPPAPTEAKDLDMVKQANAYGTTTLGWREAATVKHAIDALQQEGFQRVLLYGCSMGGAAALISQAHHPNAVVKGIITDGTFANFRDIFSDLVTRNAWWMPRFLRNLVSSASFHLVGLLAGYDPHDVRPADSLKQISLPVLILHGKSDRNLPACHGTQHGDVVKWAGFDFFPDVARCEVQSPCTVDPDNAQQLMRCAKHGSVLLYAGGHDDPSNAEVQSALWNFAKKLL